MNSVNEASFWHFSKAFERQADDILPKPLSTSTFLLADLEHQYKLLQECKESIDGLHGQELAQVFEAYLPAFHSILATRPVLRHESLENKVRNAVLETLSR